MEYREAKTEKRAMIGTLATAQSSRHGGMENTEKPPSAPKSSQCRAALRALREEKELMLVKA